MIFTTGLYYITLQYRRLMNYIKEQIEDVTPLAQKEVNEIKAKNADLEIELDELNKDKKKLISNLSNDEKIKFINKIRF